jgi:hypothetical protein
MRSTKSRTKGFQGGTSAELRVAQLIAGPSLMTDLDVVQPMEHAMTTCLLSILAGRRVVETDCLAVRNWIEVSQRASLTGSLT